MTINNEKLYFYYISLKTNFISHDDYKIWLHKNFLIDETENNIVFELEWCSENIDKTVDTLYSYLYDKISFLDFQFIGKLIINELRKKYNENPGCLRETTYKLYQIWCLLPRNIAEKEPFLTFNSIDDSWAWNGKEQVEEKMKYLFSFYEDEIQGDGC